jgi:hypothetical protein
MLLGSAGIDASTVRLVRHRHASRYQRALYFDAIHRHPRFDQYQSGQGNPVVVRQMGQAAVLASFVVDPAGHTVFIGLWRVRGTRPGHVPDPYLPKSFAGPNSSFVDLARMPELDGYAGRVVVDWGGGERAWVQYAHRRDKEIIELRRHAEVPLFPGFAEFSCSLGELDALPDSWQGVLRASRGVYLLVHRASGAQYVGSAPGGGGFLARWRGYQDGHGGNVALRDLAHAATEYDACILETVGSGVSTDELYELESRWKTKLGSRAQGLNRN